MILSLLFNLGVYGSAFVAGDFLRRKATTYGSSATYQRMRWRRLATELDLTATGVPGEFTGVWRGLSVVLDTRFVPGRQLVLGLRVQGLLALEEIERAVRTHPRFGVWPVRVADGELHLLVPFRGSTLTPADLAAWLDVVRAMSVRATSVYRDGAPKGPC